MASSYGAAPMATDAEAGNVSWARKEYWDESATTYDVGVGRYSQRAAERIVTLADAALSFNAPNVRAIDLGAGTGSIAHAIAARFPAVDVTASDISEGMLQELRSKTTPGAHIKTCVLDMAAPFAGPEGAAHRGAYSHVLSSFALQALTSPQVGVDGMRELLRPGGVVVLAGWGFDAWCGPNEVWRAAATAVDPSWKDPILERELCTSLTALKSYLEAAHFKNIQGEIWTGVFGLPPQGLMDFFWESNNPWAKERRASATGSLDAIKKAMQKVLDEEYAGVEEIKIDANIVVGRK